MLRRFVASSVVARSAPQAAFAGRQFHSKESEAYARQEELKKQILDFQDKLAPKPYNRDAKDVAFVKECYKSFENSKSLASLKVDPRQVKDSDAVHKTSNRVVY